MMNFNTWYSQNGSSYIYNNTLTNVYETRIRYKLNSQDIAEKTSNVTIQLQCRSVNSSWKTYGYTQVSTIMGITLSGKVFDMRNTNVWQIFGEQTLDLKHNEDGTLKTILSASFVTNVSSTGSLHKGNASVEVEFPTLHTPPKVNSVIVIEKNPALIEAGISNTQFVKNLSIKQFDFDYTLYDDANATSFSVLQKIEEIAYWTLSVTKTEEPITVDFSQPSDNSPWVNPYPNAFRYIVKDNLGAYGYIDEEYESFIPYFKPILNNTETKVKRDGQTSGRVLLNTKGQYFKGNIGHLSPTIKVFYKYWVKGTTEPTTYIQIPNESITVDGDNFTITDYLIGSNLDFENAYNISIYIQDNFNQTEPILKSIPVGESVWTEYKDRVDFKNATIMGKQIALVSQLCKDIEEFGTGYIRYKKDETLGYGIQVCFGTLLMAAGNTATGVFGADPGRNITGPTFAKEFSEAPVTMGLVAQPTTSTYWGIGCQYQANTTTKLGNICIQRRNTTNSSIVGYVHWSAIGKWK